MGGQSKCTPCISNEDCKCKVNEYFNNNTKLCTNCDIKALACPVGSTRTGCGGDKVGNCTLWYRPRIHKIEGGISGVSATNGGATLRIHADYIGKEANKHVHFFYGLESHINAFLQQDINSSINVGNLTNKIFEGTNCRVVKEDREMKVKS